MFARPATRPIRKAPRQVRLALEALEDHCVPATFTVNNSGDSGTGSGLFGDVRYCIAQANVASEATIIKLDSEVTKIRLQGSAGGENGLVLSNTNHSVTIQGPMGNQVIVGASKQTGLEHVNHIFTINEGVNATINNLVFAEGFDESPIYGGGGMLNFGTVSLTDCSFIGNVALNGGGLYNWGSASLTQCSFSLNFAYTATSGLGAAINNTTSDATNGYGGGVYNDGTATLVNCTLGTNTAGTAGGGLFTDDSATLVSCTISDNDAPYGGGFYNNGTVSLTITIVAFNNGDVGYDVNNNSSYDHYHSGGYNLIGFDDMYGHSGVHLPSTPTDQIGFGIGGGIDLKLAPLANYGGPTQTMALLAGSPAIHRGFAAPGVTTDQRGLPLDTPEPDVGAFQTQSGSVVKSVRIEGPAAGSGSEIVVTSGDWTATSNASWLHTSSSGSGNGLATFTFDANPGATRTGTLTIAGQTLTVTQAGNSYVAANLVTTLVSGLNSPYGVAVDTAGNVYFADAPTARSRSSSMPTCQAARSA